MKIVQCWDDGVTTDVRLVSLLRRHGARATFNLNAGLHERQRQFGWRYRDTEVWRLGRDELREVYDGFSIANHSLTHPHLDQFPIGAAKREICEGRARLQGLFDQPVSGFVYPFGTFDDAVAQAVRDAGHVYARTTRAAESGVGTIDAMAAAPSCHFWRRISGSASIVLGRPARSGSGVTPTNLPTRPCGRPSRRLSRACPPSPARNGVTRPISLMETANDFDPDRAPTDSATGRLRELLCAKR